jgi:hypothetical protein
MNTRRPDLTPYPLDAALAALTTRSGSVTITMSLGQWDSLLAAAYDDGWTLLELDTHEVPVRAYRRPESVSECPDVSGGAVGHSGADAPHSGSLFGTHDGDGTRSGHSTRRRQSDGTRNTPHTRRQAQDDERL